LVSAVVERLLIRDIDARGANGGAEALQLLDAEEFDVVVLDVRMPEIGGLEVLRRILRSQTGPKVILLSGHGSSEDAQEGMRLGAFDYLQKPVDIDRLVEIMRKAAARRRDKRA
jgi:DNA-binding NtrC family response regulator